MIDSTAFHKLNYGLYIISTEHEGERAGCVVNTLQQVTADPIQVSVAVNKENRTADVIKQAGHFTASVLDETATMDLIGTFGFHSSTDTDKFADTQFATDANGLPYVTEHACARLSARVVNTVDVGTHYLFIGQVEQAENLSEEPPMTYAYYYAVKGGKTPPKASSFDPNAAAFDAAATGNTAKVGWRCTICGYVEYVDELPDDFVCPVCGVGKEMFERIEL